MTIVKHLEEIKEEPHPFLKGVTMKPLLSKRDENADKTCIIVRCKKGSEIEEHVHLFQDDIIYVLHGEANMKIEGFGEIKLEPGSFIVVPKGKHHKTYNVAKDLIIYDIFCPPIM